jgi:hypothetical protein
MSKLQVRCFPPDFRVFDRISMIPVEQAQLQEKNFHQADQSRSIGVILVPRQFFLVQLRIRL